RGGVGVRVVDRADLGLEGRAWADPGHRVGVPRADAEAHEAVVTAEVRRRDPCPGLDLEALRLDVVALHLAAVAVVAVDHEPVRAGRSRLRSITERERGDEGL